MKSIEITVTQDGEVKIGAIGFKGKDCELATKPFEEALGAVQQRKKKPEYHSQTTTQQNQSVG